MLSDDSRDGSVGHNMALNELGRSLVDVASYHLTLPLQTVETSLARDYGGMPVPRNKLGWSYYRRLHWRQCYVRYSIAGRAEVVLSAVKYGMLGGGD